MKLLLLLISFAASMTVVDYDGGPVEGDAWITLVLHGDATQLLTLQHVTWCKSFVPNDQGPPELSPDCSGRNLMRLQLFPSSEEVILKERPDDENTAATTAAASGPRFYIDPTRVGGWDTRHQWNIYLEMSQRNGLVYRESVRFNALTPVTTTTTSASASATTATKEPTTASPIHTIFHGPATPPVVHAWKGAILVLSIGSFSVLALVGLIKYLQSSPPPAVPLANQRTEMQARVYANGSVYPFERHHDEGIEMTDFSSEDERLRREDLQILEMIH